MREAVNLLILLLAVSEISCRNEVLGFQCQFAPNRAQSSHRRAASSHADTDALPTIMNPTTKRNIQIGGPTFTEFIKQGGWVQHGGTLKRLNLEALRRYQHGESDHSQNKHENDCETPMEEWYCITPTIITHDDDTSNVDMELLRKELLFVNKPSGMHCVPSRDLTIDSLSAQVSSIYGDTAKPCHRLDRDTSGIVVFGLSKNAHRDVAKQFEARTTVKTYTALVAGHFKQECGVIDMPIGKIKTMEGFNRWIIGGDKPRDAVTEWRVDETFTVDGANFTRVLLTPKTGRGHQLRLHMKAMGHPILGDTIHGDGGVADCSPRLCLHAQKLQVNWNGMSIQAQSFAPF